MSSRSVLGPSPSLFQRPVSQPMLEKTTKLFGRIREATLSECCKLPTRRSFGLWSKRLCAVKCPDGFLTAWLAGALQANKVLAWLNIVSASLTSNLPGPSTLSDLTTPSTTNIE